jgi:hypothetical protein
MVRTVLRLAGGALLVLLAVLCDAPHDNPLDPQNGGAILGRVLTRRATPIAGATVSAVPSGRSCATDSSGSFELLGLPVNDVQLCFRAEGYVPESAIVELARERIDTTTRYLNGLPTVTSCRVSSHVFGQSWPPEPLYFFRLSAAVADLDGETDVESVWAEIPAVGLAQRLAFDPDSLHYDATVWLRSLPVPSPETLVGQDVVFRVEDREGALGHGPDCSVNRIIYDLPEPAFPAGGVDTVASDTSFFWHKFDRGFRVGYRCEVVRIVGGGPAGVVLSVTTPGPADTSFSVSRSVLPAGDCYWTVEAVDAFGNSSRSAEERFNVR